MNNPTHLPPGTLALRQAMDARVDAIARAKVRARIDAAREREERALATEDAHKHRARKREDAAIVERRARDDTNRARRRALEDESRAQARQAEDEARVARRRAEDRDRHANRDRLFEARIARLEALAPNVAPAESEREAPVTRPAKVARDRRGT